MSFQFSHRQFVIVLQGILWLAVIGSLWEQQWLNALLTVGIILTTLTPQLLARRYRLDIPYRFQLLAIAFLFAALFLGEMRDFYGRFWWWDILLHTSSGFLLGIVGFLLVHVLNETEEIGLHMKPGFVAFFAFLFALGVGALWELFEFSMDTFFGMNMQKPMLGDPSGLTDTMVDLLVDAIGALVIALLGYRRLKMADRQSFLHRWLRSFIDRNPRLFRRG
ncbi:hypothetical protein [Alkalilimnicola sp. S0819]|uniref:hypothetical protein n=1 Tax=Alkalilimnicola sp. S0819 TaxID=2613922 RepID=UPI00126235BB|nr:hypothetical protein [Alkalilimnicola sp. S0819]KAB7619564.1 hypothetical protein F3N43_13320 [Alkalilimnicola sp. S0819]MPQ17615.1 hypothetical protein [Alkalilimnicola sp. S0819]